MKYFNVFDYIRFNNKLLDLVGMIRIINTLYVEYLYLK